jgi:cytochrome c-type biogenesis protein CcmH/NrfG
LESAEKSARQGIRLDEEHQLPKLQFLLGLVLVQRRQYEDAAVYLRQYLQLVPNGKDSDGARKELAAIDQRTASQHAPAVSEKK